MDRPRAQGPRSPLTAPHWLLTSLPVSSEETDPVRTGLVLTRTTSQRTVLFLTEQHPASRREVAKRAAQHRCHVQRLPPTRSAATSPVQALVYE